MRGRTSRAERSYKANAGRRAGRRKLVGGIATAVFIAVVGALPLVAWGTLPSSAYSISPTIAQYTTQPTTTTTTTTTTTATPVTACLSCLAVAPTSVYVPPSNPCELHPVTCLNSAVNPGLVSGSYANPGTGSTGPTDPGSATGPSGPTGSSGGGSSNGTGTTSSGSGSQGSGASDSGSGAGPAPVIDSTPTPTAPFVPAPVKAQLSVGVSGGGLVAGKGGGQTLACGANAVKCFGTFAPGTQLTLRAAPSKGFEFTGWGGGCKGTGPNCLITLSKTSSVSAKFAASPGAAVAPLEIADASFHVGWNAGSGSGALMVKGKAGLASDISVQLRRSNGTPVATGQFSIPSGGFGVSVKLEPGLIAGALVPGSYVVAVNGASGGHEITPVIKVVVLPAPAQGVVQRAFASGSANGSPTASLHGTQAFVHFVFASPPTSKQPLTVAWFEPGGKLLGVAKKSPGLSIVSSISSKTALPKGVWHAELRLGSRVIVTLELHVS